MASKTFTPGTVIDSTWLNDVNVAVYTTVPQLTSTQSLYATYAASMDALQAQVTAATTAATNAQTAANTAQATSAKDASGGYVGLTGYSINFKNASGAITSNLVNTATASRTYTFPDKNLTVAGTINETLINPTIVGYIEQFQTLNTASAITISTANGTMIELTITASSAITLPTAVPGLCYTLIVKYGGAYTPTFTGGTALKWAGGAAPTPTATNGKMDKYVFTCGSTYTLGQDGGRNF